MSPKIYQSASVTFSLIHYSGGYKWITENSCYFMGEKAPYSLAQKLRLLEYGERETLSPLLAFADQLETFLLSSVNFCSNTKISRAVFLHSLHKSFTF